MTSERKREERAFEALIVSAFRSAGCEDVGSIREANEKERAALKLLGPGFVNELLAGRRRELDCLTEKGGLEDELALAGECAGGILNRADDVDEATAQELEQKEREIIERKRKEQQEDEEAS
jgi:hypothetical protein